MRRRTIRRRRRLVAVAVLLLALSPALVALLAPTRASVAQEAPAPLRYEGWVSGHGSLLLGGASRTGEVWAARAARPGANAAPAPILLRYRGGEGWVQAEPALDEAGRPYGGGTLRDGRVTASGGVVLVADDDARPAGERRVVMVRDATGPARVQSQPPAGTLLPADGSVPAETLSSGVLAARDRDGTTEGFLGAVGRPLETGVVRVAGGAWSREPLCVAADAAGTPPPGCSVEETLTGSSGALEVVALAAAEEGGAWALARAERGSGRGLVLFERFGAGGDDDPIRWRLRELGTSLFGAAATPSRGIANVLALGGGSALTATSRGVWLDGTFEFRAAAHDVSVYFDGTTATSWCDPADATGPLCDTPLGIDLDARQQSFAWAGSDYGTRVVGEFDGRYATLEGRAFVSRPTFAGPNPRLAFAAPDEGWIGSVHVTRDPWASPLAGWSVPLRRPVTAVAGEPGRVAGDLAAQALAVGTRGSVMRYQPGQGWDSEGLLSAGGVATPNLRGVAWPEPSVAYAVGDEGAMWRWRSATNLWEPDPAAPFDFFSHLTGIAFQPGDPNRGYVVGRGGVLLRYGKSWEQETLPPEVQPSAPDGAAVDLTSVAFAGSQALVAAGRQLLVNDGSGWRVDPQAAELIAGAGAGAEIFVVAGLPDGGAVAAGAGVVLERDGPSAPWRYSVQPPPSTVVAAAAFRDGGTVRALVSVSGPSVYRLPQDQPPASDPGAPPPRPPAFTLPADGYLVRETAAGWRDEQRTLLRGELADPSRKSDPILALLTDAAGRGWAVGGWNSLLDMTAHGNDVGVTGLISGMETGSVSRYDPAGPPTSANVRAAAVPQAAGPVRLAVGGGARCGGACASLAAIETGPDRTLSRALALAGELSAPAQGPRALIYTGGRAATGGEAEQRRFAELMAAATLPLLPAVADGEAVGRSSLAYEQAFAAFPQPLGEGSLAAELRPVAIGATPASGRARTHYAVDTLGPEGTVRVVVIDNATGSLAARDGIGNPAEDQATWLRAVLEDARASGVPAVVVGNRPLSPAVEGAATDAQEVAAILRDNGASAYLYEGRQEQRRSAIPLGTGEVPAFASGTLGYRAPTEKLGYDPPALLMLELDAARRDPATNRAPVAVRLIPVIEDLALEAVDGRVLNRSQPALFRGLGRRPRSGDTQDQYVELPNSLCTGSLRCLDRLDPEVRFSSSDPDIADFVRVDRSSPNPRKPLLDPATDKVVPDSSSGLLCAFNAGSATVTIEAGGLAYSTTVTVRDGSVLRPCGTMPLDARRFPRAPPPRASIPPTAPPPADDPPEDRPPVVAPPPPPPATVPVAVEQPQPRPQPTPEPRAPPERRAPPARDRPTPFLPQAAAPPALIPLSPPPPPPSVARPIPPSGTAPVSINVPVAQPVAQVERQREEEEALEQSQAYVRVTADHEPGRVAAPLLVLILLAAAGAGAIRRPRRDRGYAYADDRTRRFR